jgi:hypothetical protein
VNKRKNFPSFQTLLARWVIGKIRMCFGASDVPVAVKCRTMNASSSLKKTSCTSYPCPHTVHYIYVNFTACIFT